MFTGRNDDIDYAGYGFGYIVGNGTHDSSHELVGTDFCTVLYGSGFCCRRIGEESKSRDFVSNMKDSVWRFSEMEAEWWNLCIGICVCVGELG